MGFRVKGVPFSGMRSPNDSKMLTSTSENAGIAIEAWCALWG